MCWWFGLHTADEKWVSYHTHTTPQNTITFLFSSVQLQKKYIEQYLNTILHGSNKHCGNDKYVFLLQGRLTITLCTPSWSVCSRRAAAVCVAFSLFSFCRLRQTFRLSAEKVGGHRWSQSYGPAHQDKDCWWLIETFAPGPRGKFMSLCPEFPLPG